MFQFEGDLGPKPWPLEIARFLAPAVTSYTVVLAVLRVMGLRWQLWRLRGHVVVCGLGHKGVYLAKRHLREGKRVVIIEADEDNDWIAACRMAEALMIKAVRVAHFANQARLGSPSLTRTPNGRGTCFGPSSHSPIRRQTSDSERVRHRIRPSGATWWRGPPTLSTC
jgi:hypothetical protein